MAPAWKSVVAGLFVADFLTAFFHWLEDTYLPFTDAPGMLGQIARDNEMHHYIPYSVTVGTWWQNCKVSVQLVAAAGLALVLVAPRWVANNRVFVLTVALLVALASLVHRFQHERDCLRPRLVTALMACGLLVSREQHQVHHRHADTNYSVLLGFTNPIYDGLGVWRGLEAVLSAVGLPKPMRKKGVAEYAALQDDWLRTTLSQECPARLSAQQMEVYHARLEQAYRSGELRP